MGPDGDGFGEGDGTGEARRLTRLGFLPRLIRTSAFRYTLIYTVFFVLSILGIGYFVYQATIGQSMKRLDAELVAEFEYLASVSQSVGINDLRALSAVQTEIGRLRYVNKGNALYLVVLAGSPVTVLTSDLPQAPPEMLNAEGMFEFDYTARSVNAAGEVVPVTRPAVGRTAEFIYPNADGGSDRAIILAARDIGDLDQLRQRSRWLFARLGGVVIVIGLILGAIYSATFLRRVDNIGRTVGAISEGDLTLRVALSGSGDEFDKLSMTINAMLDQIERLMTGMRQVSDNIAHDLRSPLTRIKVRLETALGDDDADKSAVLEQTTDDVERLLATFNALLSITRLESGEGGGSKVAVDVAAVAEELAELYEPAADDEGFSFRARIERVPPILGSRELISQMIANLLDNALKYAKRPANDAQRPVIELSVTERPGGGVLLTVLDNGPGVSEADRERILRRFVRLERSRSTQGNGLGLSLVAAIARRHDATLSVGRGLPHTEKARELQTHDAYGLGVRVAFPPAPAAPRKPAPEQAVPGRPGSA